MGLGLGIALGLLPGCVPDPKPGFDSPAPTKRLDAIVNASRLEDEESLVRLVEKLRSPDPVERMFAIRSLEIRTDQTLGYDHAAEHWERIEAYERWLRYLEEQGIDTGGIRDDASGGDEGQGDRPMEEDAG